MKKWTNGRHDVSDRFAYFVEYEWIDRGVVYDKNGGAKAVYPYVKDRSGGFRAAFLKANKRNFEKVWWF